MKQETKLIIIIGALIVIGIIARGFLFVVDETEQVIIVQLGNPVGDAIDTPGLHFKLPFIQERKIFDKRWLPWDGDANQIPTKDKKYIWVDTYARWRIVDPLLFFQNVRDERGAYSRLDDIIDGATRNAIAQYDLIEIVRTSLGYLKTNEEQNQQTTKDSTNQIRVKYGRQVISDEILKKSSIVTKEYGIEIVDVRIKRINYSEKVRLKVYDRMISERQRIAEQYRSEGQGKSAEIGGLKEKELKRITSEAYKIAQQIKGKAEGKATKIYAKAFNNDPEFYTFQKTLESYEKTLDEKSTLLLTTDSEYYKFLKKLR